MSEWTAWLQEKPPVGQLVIVDFGGFDCLRLRTLNENGELYSEDEFLDDGGLEPLGWHPLPERIPS